MEETGCIYLIDTALFLTVNLERDCDHSQVVDEWCRTDPRTNLGPWWGLGWVKNVKSDQIILLLYSYLY